MVYMIWENILLLLKVIFLTRLEHMNSGWLSHRNYSRLLPYNMCTHRVSLAISLLSCIKSGKHPLEKHFLHNMESVNKYEGKPVTIDVNSTFPFLLDLTYVHVHTHTHTHTHTRTHTHSLHSLTHIRTCPIRRVLYVLVCVCVCVCVCVVWCVEQGGHGW